MFLIALLLLKPLKIRLRPFLIALIPAIIVYFLQFSVNNRSKFVFGGSNRFDFGIDVYKVTNKKVIRSKGICIQDVKHDYKNLLP